MKKFFIGTSGWKYPHWANGVFYPQGLAQSKWLEYYAQFFNAIELNITFYRLPEKKVFLKWYNLTPKEFFFVVKGSRFITHIKRLKDIKEPLSLFFDNIGALKDKLAAVLWQLPPNYKIDLRRLELFLKQLKKTKIRQVFEFRDASWFNPKVYALLKKYNACLCIADSNVFPCEKEVTADFIYLRFHGREVLYGSEYSDQELKKWAEFVGHCVDKTVFSFFNNDARGFAVKNALRFRELLEE